MSFTLGPALGGLVEEIEGAEALRVGVFEVFEFAFEEDVVFTDVAEDEGDFCFVGGVFENGAGELVHTVISVSTVYLLGIVYGKCCGRMRTYGVIPVPPAINAIWSCLFGSQGYLGIGPLKSNRCPGFMLCICSLIGPFG